MASVSKRRWKSPDGSMKEAWTVRYFDDAGKRRSKGFDLKKDADAYARKVQREIEDGTHTPDSETATVKEVAAAFLEHADQRFRDGRIGRSRLVTLTNILNNRVVPMIGNVRMKDVTPMLAEDVYARLMKERKISPATARTTMRDLVLVERFARRRKFTRSSPIADAYAELGAIKRPVVRPFSRDDIAALLIAAETHRFKAKAYSTELMNCLVNIAALCGLRLGEICGLTVDSIDFDAGLIRVRHSLTQWDELKGPKTAAGIRDVPMPDRVSRLLYLWLHNRYIPNPRRLMFRTHKGGFIDRASLHRTWTNLLAQAGLSDEGANRRFHALRHFFASNMVALAAPLPELALTIGHSSFDTTLRVYTHAMDRRGIDRRLIDQSVSGVLQLTDARVTQEPLSA